MLTFRVPPGPFRESQIQRSADEYLADHKQKTRQRATTFTTFQAAGGLKAAAIQMVYKVESVLEDYGLPYVWQYMQVTSEGRIVFDHDVHFPEDELHRMDELNGLLDLAASESQAAFGYEFFHAGNGKFASEDLLEMKTAAPEREEPAPKDAGVQPLENAETATGPDAGGQNQRADTPETPKTPEKVEQEKERALIEAKIKARVSAKTWGGAEDLYALLGLKPTGKTPDDMVKAAVTLILDLPALDETERSAFNEIVQKIGETDADLAESLASSYREVKRHFQC